MMPLFSLRLTLLFLAVCVCACSAEDPVITAARDANAAYLFTDLASAVPAYGEHVTTILNKKIELGQIVKGDGSSGSWPTHDVIYEMVSLLSAPGGESKIATDVRYPQFHKARAGKHGGFVEYYTRLLCAARGIPQSPPKHPFHFSVVASFCARFPSHCWRTFMQNEYFDELGRAAAAEWALHTDKCEHEAYTMRIPAKKYDGVMQTLFSIDFYGPHLKGGWCAAVGDRENGLCHPQCEKQCYAQQDKDQSEDQSVDPCFKYCAASTDAAPDAAHPTHREL